MVRLEDAHMEHMMDQEVWMQLHLVRDLSQIGNDLEGTLIFVY